MGQEKYNCSISPNCACLIQSNWYMDANMLTGKRSQPWFTALGAFWPGVQVLLGDQAAAAQSMLLFADIWRRYGFVPEAFDLYNDKVHDRCDVVGVKGQYVIFSLGFWGAGCEVTSCDRRWPNRSTTCTGRRAIRCG